MTNVSGHIESWDELPWKKFQVSTYRLQTRIYRASKVNDQQKVHSLQRLLLGSKAAKFLAIRRVTQDNRGKNTAGVDGKAKLSPRERMDLAENMDLRAKPDPIRRVYIPKPGRDEMRPLGIPTMRDRARQALVKMALEPEWEAKFETHSYGFRPGRSAHDAIAQIFIGIRRKPKYVLDADIEKCFDRINHDKLMSKMNTIKPVEDLVRGWLKAGIMDNGKTLFPKEGTPQGGVISPLLANIALHGMQEAVQRKAEEIHGADAKYGGSKPQTIRYADDFVIMHHDLSTLSQLRVAAEEFLQDLGLQLKEEKTRTTHTLEGKGFDFLGFRIRQFPVGKHNSGKNRYGTRLGFKTIITPSKEAVKRHIAAMNRVVDAHKSAPRAALIQKLTLLIRGWCMYYRTVASKDAFNRTDKALYEQLIAWLRRRHKRGTRKAVNANFDEKWRLKDGDMVLKKHSETTIKRHVKVKGEKSPYDGDLVYWAARTGKSVVLNSRVAALLKKQHRKCAHCQLLFTPSDIMEVHHRDGNRRNDTFANFNLLHGHCHDTVHRRSA